MPTTFHTPKNQVSTTLSAPRSAGAAVLEVADGSVFGAAFPLIATAVRGSTVLCILELTGRVGNTLTISGAIEGTTDADLVAGDRIEMRPTALALTEIQDAMHALEANVTDLVAREATTVSTTESHADPSWIASLAGAKITGDIAGRAASITGSIAASQVTGLAADLASKADDASVVHRTGNESMTGVWSFSETLSGAGSGVLVASSTSADVDLYEVTAILASHTDSSAADSGAASHYTIWANYNKTGAATITGYQQGCFWGNSTIGAGTINVHDLFNGRCEVSAGASVTHLTHFKADSAYATIGTVTDRHGFHCNDFVSPCGTQHGLHIDELTSGTGGNFAVYTAGSTPSYFGGPITAHGGISGDGSGLSGVVHSSGDEVVAGTKTFSGGIILSLAPQLPTLADAEAPDNSLFFGSDHLDGGGHAQLCRKQGGTTTPIG